jgi:serine/threonine protein kinase
MGYPAGYVVAGHVKLLERLGGGGQGTVFKALDLVDEEVVALKFLDGHTDIGQVQREYRPLKRIDHPNIVGARQVAHTEEGEWLIVTDFVDGRSLREHLQEHGQLGLNELRDLGTQLLAALSAIHPDEDELAELLAAENLKPEQFDRLQELQATGLVHRDIKPENLILRRDAHVVLVDFGISARAGTIARTWRWTPGYWPPDLTAGAFDRWDPDVDRYAAGATLFEAACGVLPSEGVDRLAEMVDPHECRPDLPSAVVEFFLDACWPQRDGRFESTADMVEAWRAAWDGFADGQLVAPVPFSPWPVSPEPPLDQLDDNDVRELLVEIVESEGPIRCSRLYDLVKAASGTRPTSRLNQLTYRMASQWNGSLSQVEPLGGGQQDKTVYVKGSDPSVYRTLGERPLPELPEIELRVHVRHAVRWLESAGARRNNLDAIATRVAATLGPELSSTERDDLVRGVRWRVQAIIDRIRQEGP